MQVFVNTDKIAKLYHYDTSKHIWTLLASFPDSLEDTRYKSAALFVLENKDYYIFAHGVKPRIGLHQRLGSQLDSLRHDLNNDVKSHYLDFSDFKNIFNNYDKQRNKPKNSNDKIKHLAMLARQRKYNEAHKHPHKPR